MNNRSLWIVLIVFFFIIGAAGSYIFLKYVDPAHNQPQTQEGQVQTVDALDVMVIRLYLPSNNRLETVERKIPKRSRSSAIAEAVLEEFFRPQSHASPVPQGVRVLGIYRDAALTLYIDLSDELRRNFQGDALAEYLVLKGMHDSLVANLQDLSEIKILVEGKEIESFGGHFYLKYPLKNSLVSDAPGEGKPVHD